MTTEESLVGTLDSRITVCVNSILRMINENGFKVADVRICAEFLLMIGGHHVDLGIAESAEMQRMAKYFLMEWLLFNNLFIAMENDSVVLQSVTEELLASWDQDSVVEWKLARTNVLERRAAKDV